ncbi:MAG: MBL fold metallo-hydrolase, partial [Steroidobacteraceae bacterium]
RARYVPVFIYEGESMRLAVSLTVLSIAATLTAWADQPAAPRKEAKPAVAAAHNEDVRAFSIGKLKAVALRDGRLQFPNDGKTLGVGHSAEEIAALLLAAGQPTARVELSIQPLLVKAPQRVLLFDTGAGANMGAGAGKLPASMAGAGIDPASVTDVFISHVHGDHVGGLLTKDGKAAFPNAAIHISKPEWTFLRGMDKEKAAGIGIQQYTALMAAVSAKVVAFEPNAELIPGVVKAVEIKGHTPGHSGYQITSGSRSLLYIADAMHHVVVSVQKPDWPIAFDADGATAQASRKALLAQTASAGQRIYAVHFPFPGLGKFERKGDHFVWKAE